MADIITHSATPEDLERWNQASIDWMLGRHDSRQADKEATAVQKENERLWREKHPEMGQ